MIENPLKLGGSFGGVTGCEVRQSADVDGVQPAEASDEADASERDIVARSDLQRLDGRGRIASVQ
jgi:hypothetical protein